MDTIAVSEFKAHALQLINRVNKERKTILLTNRGRPVAELHPHVPIGEKPVPGGLLGTVLETGDIVAPLGEADWEASR